MGLFGSVVRFVGSAVRKVATLVVSVAKMVVRTVVEVGRTVRHAARGLIKKLGEVVEDVARRMQGKRSRALEELTRTAERLVQRARVELERGDVSEYAAWARVHAVSLLVDPLFRLVSEARAMSDVPSDVVCFLEEGERILVSPEAASDQAIEALMRLSEQLVGKSVEEIAVEVLLHQFMDACESVRELLEEAQMQFADAAVQVKLRRLENQGQRELEEATAVQADLGNQVARLQARFEDLRLVVTVCEGTLQCLQSEDKRLYYEEDLGEVQETLFALHQRGNDAVLELEERQLLQRFGLEFWASAGRRHAQTQSEVGVEA